MESKYYPNYFKFILPLMSLLIPCIMSYVSITSKRILLELFGIFILFLVIVFIVKLVSYIKKPLLIVKGSQIQLNSFLKGVNTIQKLENYSLVISVDYLAFRPVKKKANDIIVSKSDIKHSEWIDLIECLKKLKFNKIIKK